MASVSKRPWEAPDGSIKEAWAVRWVNAEGKRKYRQFKLKKEADTFLRKVERELEDGTHLALSMTVAEINREFLRDSEQRERRGEIRWPWLKRLEQFCRHFDAHVGSKVWKDLSVSDVDGLYRFLINDQGIVPYSARMMVSNMKTIEKFALRRGFLKTTPVAAAYFGIKAPARAKIKVLGVDEIHTILREALKRPSGYGKRPHAWLACYVHLAAFCGLRLGEICALKWQHLDLEAGMLSVRHGIEEKTGILKGPKSAAGNRDVPLPAHLTAMLHEWRVSHWQEGSEGFVFTVKPDKPIRAKDVNRQWNLLQDRAGIRDPENPYHFHALRHFAGSWWLHNGVPIADVTAMIGHANPSTTLGIYTHSLSKRHDRQREMEAVAARLTGPVATPAQHEA